MCSGIPSLKGLHFVVICPESGFSKPMDKPMTSSQANVHPSSLEALVPSDRQLTNLHTLKLAVLDAIEYAESRDDLNLALVYAGLLRKDLDPLLRGRLGL